MWAAMEPPAAQELEVALLQGQAAGCSMMVAAMVSAKGHPAMDYCNWPALAALTDLLDQQLGCG